MKFMMKILKIIHFYFKCEAFFGGGGDTLYNHLKGCNTRKNLFRVLVIGFSNSASNSGSNDV